MTLAEFLLARIAARESIAIDALTVWDDEDERLEWEDLSDAAFRHARTNNPGQVLADCEAKRRIVEHCDFDHLTLSPGDTYVLQLLALPYADHPDYRKEWKP